MLGILFAFFLGLTLGTVASAFMIAVADSHREKRWRTGVGDRRR